MAEGGSSSVRTGTWLNACFARQGNRGGFRNEGVHADL